MRASVSMLAEPSAPQDLKITTNQTIVPNGKQVLDVSWKAPISPNGKITGYIISWWSINLFPPLLVKDRVPRENLSYTIKNLPACIQVSVVVAASNLYIGDNISVETAHTYVNRMHCFRLYIKPYTYSIYTV